MKIIFSKLRLSVVYPLGSLPANLEGGPMFAHKALLSTTGTGAES